jgi:hypothetical protein
VDGGAHPRLENSPITLDFHLWRFPRPPSSKRRDQNFAKYPHCSAGSSEFHPRRRVLGTILRRADSHEDEVERLQTGDNESPGCSGERNSLETIDVTEVGNEILGVNHNAFAASRDVIEHIAILLKSNAPPPRCCLAVAIDPAQSRHNSIAFEPVSSNRSLRCGETEFQGRDKEAETALEIQERRCRDKISPGNSANSGLIAGFREISVRTRMRGGAERRRHLS